MTVAAVAYEEIQAADCGCAQGESWGARVRACFVALGSRDPEADMESAATYLRNAQSAGIDPGMAAAIAYSTVHHAHPVVAPGVALPGVATEPRHRLSWHKDPNPPAPGVAGVGDHSWVATSRSTNKGVRDFYRIYEVPKGWMLTYGSANPRDARGVAGIYISLDAAKGKAQSIENGDPVRESVASDYFAVHHGGHKVRYKNYGDAKSDADAHGGYVEYAAGEKAGQQVDPDDVSDPSWDRGLPEDDRDAPETRADLSRVVVRALVSHADVRKAPWRVTLLSHTGQEIAEATDESVIGAFDKAAAAAKKKSMSVPIYLQNGFREKYSALPPASVMHGSYFGQWPAKGLDEAAAESNFRRRAARRQGKDPDAVKLGVYRGVAYRIYKEKAGVYSLLIDGEARGGFGFWHDGYRSAVEAETDAVRQINEYPQRYNADAVGGANESRAKKMKLGISGEEARDCVGVHTHTPVNPAAVVIAAGEGPHKEDLGDGAYLGWWDGSPDQQATVYVDDQAVGNVFKMSTGSKRWLLNPFFAPPGSTEYATRRDAALALVARRRAGAAEQKETDPGPEYAGEQRPVVGKPRKLRWHRGEEEGSYYAEGQLGKYTIHKRTPDRRHGILPVVLELHGKMLGEAGFDSKTDAQDFATAYDLVLPYAAPGETDVRVEDGHALVRGAKIIDGCLPWVRVTKDPERFKSCLATAQRIGRIDSGAKVYELLAPYLLAADQEVYLVVLLDVQQMVRGVAEVARGQRSQVMVDPADVLRPVIITGASSFWCCHNHPSSKADPSGADKRLTRAIEKAAKAACPDVEFAGHITIGEGAWGDADSGKVHRV